MATAASTKDRPSEIAIFARLLENGRAKLSPSLARYILTLGFDADDQHRMGELAERNQGSELTQDEHEELMSFVKVGHLLAMLHSRARKALKNK
jgi:hypothetical protein